MELKFFLKTDLNRLTVIAEDTYDSSTTDKKLFQWSNSATMNVVCKMNEDGEATFVDARILPHYVTTKSTNVDDKMSFLLEEDGVFEVYHVIIPTQKWVAQYTNAELYAAYPNGIYYFDASTNKCIFHKLTKSTTSSTTTYTTEDTCVEFETIGQSFVTEVQNNFENGVFKCNYDSDQILSLHFLRLCYVNYCQKILDGYTCSKCNSTSENITYKRDLASMALSIIQYCMDLNHFDEAARILDWIHACGGICSNNITNERKSGCGCHQ